MYLRELTWAAICVRVFTSLLAGGLIGLERGLKNRPAGMRTYMLVCLGSCIVMLTNQYIFQISHTGDPVRMGAQVVSGIGFLGAGTIVVTHRSHIRGLTTAAGLWASAAVGLSLGIGFYEAAVLGGFGVFFSMSVLQGLDMRLHRKTKALEIYFELDPGFTLGQFLRAAQEQSLEVRDVQQEVCKYTDRKAYIATVKVPRRRDLTELSEEVRKLPGVAFVECL